MFKKLFLVAIALLVVVAPSASLAQGKKDSVVMAMALEPPGLDPTTAAAAAIAEVTLYNVYETLTKVNEDGSVSPLLAESWQASPDLKTYTFKLRKGVKFQNGEPFDSAAVKFSFERNAAANSTNKDKSLFQSFESVTAPDADTVVIALKYSEPNLPFLMGQATAAIVEPKSAPTNATQPVGTGPYQLGAWAKGSSITLNKWADYRNASAIKLNKVTIRFISDPAAQVAALLSGDVDAFPRVAAARSLAQFKADPRFNVQIGGSKAKTIVYTTDMSGLYASRLKLANPADHVVLPEIISKEPLGPMVRHGDDQWFDIVKWTLFAMINAEEMGVTQKNADEMAKSDKPDLKRAFGTDGNFGEQLGLTKDWFSRIIKAVGNYGEAFDRNVGAGSKLQIARGVNQLWNKGGIQYAPPIR